MARDIMEKFIFSRKTSSSLRKTSANSEIIPPTNLIPFHLPPSPQKDPNMHYSKSAHEKPTTSTVTHVLPAPHHSSFIIHHFTSPPGKYSNKKTSYSSRKWHAPFLNTQKNAIFIEFTRGK
jgi:hypothetical protein